MNNFDLFGEEIKHPPKTQAKGNAAPIGSGPQGETCGTCGNAYGIRSCGKIYYKCALVKATNGIGTDIRLKWAACNRWKKDV